MTRAGTGSQAPPGAVSAPAGRADTCFRAAAGVTVAGLAGIAGAISCASAPGAPASRPDPAGARPPDGPDDGTAR